MTSPPVEPAGIVDRGAGSLWQRLAQGVRRLVATPGWAHLAGDDWPDRIMQVATTDDFHAKQGRSTARWVIERGTDRLTVYLKRHYRLPWWQCLLATLLPGRGGTPAFQERRNLDWAASQGVLVPAVEAAGEFIGPWGRLQSFLAIRELTGMLALHEAIPLAARHLSPERFRLWKRGLAGEVARISRFLHERKRFHKDLYLCHFYVARADTMVVPESWRERVHLIDLHRLAHHPWTWPFWITKDLGELLFSSDLPEIDDRDRLYFWRAYLGQRRHGWAGRLLGRLVRLRGARYGRHNRKLASAARRAA